MPDAGLDARGSSARDTPWSGLCHTDLLLTIKNHDSGLTVSVYFLLQAAIDGRVLSDDKH